MRVLLIDLHNLAHRAAHAHKGLWSPDKQVHTGVYYGVFNSLQTYVSQFQPDNVWIISDPNDPSEKRNWRSSVWPDYKRRDKKRNADEEKQVNAIRQQMPVLKQALLLTNVLWMEQPFLEADEIIGWLWRYYDKALHFTVVSTDKDMFTLLRPGFDIYYPGKRRELFIDHNNFARYSAEFITGNSKRADEDKYHFPTVKEWAEFRWLSGDDSDMIPGLPSCGPAGARKILDGGGYASFCESTEKLLAEGKKVGKKEAVWITKEAKEIYERNKLLMRINPPPDEYVLFEMQNERCAVGQANFEALSQWMQSLNFSSKENSLIDRMRSSALCIPKDGAYTPLRHW